MANQYIGLDWGTSSLRAYLFDAEGAVRAQRDADWGVMNLPILPDGDVTDLSARFSHAFWQLLGDWLQQPEVDRCVVACGMVGSAQGWVQAPYMPLPISLRALAGTLTPVDAGRGVTLAVASGLIERGAMPDVLRGEETQVAGVPGLLAARDQAMDGPWLLGLPGTHSKWVAVQDGTICHFHTYMTGEVFGLLVRHSILGRTMGQPLSVDDVRARRAFDLGLENACSASGAQGMLGTIFSSRTLGLTQVLAPEEQRDYLSGLLLGHEVTGLRAALEGPWRQARIALVGRDALCARYHQALQRLGLDALILSEDAGIHGLWSLIRENSRQPA